MKLDSTVLELIQRSHTAYFCFTILEEDSMKDALLSFFGLRKFAKYEIDLSPVWIDRQSLLVYHTALIIEKNMHVLISEKKWDEVAGITREIFPKWSLEIEFHACEVWITNKFSHLRIWTRILSASSQAFGRLKLYREEDDLLFAILDQDIFAQEKRGSIHHLT